MGSFSIQMMPSPKPAVIVPLWTKAQSRATRRIPEGLEHVITRRADVSDAPRVAALFHETYRNSSHPFQSTAGVAEFLEDSRNFQIVAEADGHLVASMAMTYNTWNNAYELGRAITVPEYRRNGLAANLMQQVVDLVAERELGELIFGYPRARRIVDICATLHPRMIPVGHDAGRNVANGSRETHLIVCGIPAHARFTHIVPEASEVLRPRFVREMIYAPLGLRGIPGAYPFQCFVGTVLQHAVPSGPWLFDYEVGNPSGALEVIEREPDGSTPSEIARELDHHLSAIPEVQHVTATILADKVSLIHALVERRFEISAYLPAWYSNGRRRYDCIQLARRQYTTAAGTQDFPDILDSLRAAFAARPISAQPGRKTQLCV